MGTVLTYVEVQGDQVKRSSLEVLTRCREIARERGQNFAAVVAAPDPAQYTDQLARFGATRIYSIQHAVFEHHLNPPLLDALEVAAEAALPDLIAFPSSESVKEILGALAVRLDAAALPDVAELEVTDGGVEALRPVLAAKFLARVRAEGHPVLVSVRSGAYEATEERVEAEVVDLPFAFDPASVKQVLREVSETREGSVDLAEARIVVAAGRGIRDEKGKVLVEELAELLGAAIGSSRAVVESGLFPASSQVGQTGKVVSPELYIALGISGAIQHVAGMANSRVIIAVNKDPDAPIMKMATYGIVGDVYDIVPRLIQALKSV